MANEKPQITATIKFRGVTIEGMTVEELRQLRDVLNQIVGEKVVEKHIHHDYYRPYGPISLGRNTWAVASGKITLGNTTNQMRLGEYARNSDLHPKDTLMNPDTEGAHYTIGIN